jgi:hypothetical protein
VSEHFRAGELDGDKVTASALLLKLTQLLLKDLLSHGRFPRAIDLIPVRPEMLGAL